MAVILVVDDEFLLVDMLDAYLTDAGHEVLTAPHGAAALVRMCDQRPHVVVTDYMMPVMNGAEFAAAVRTDPDLRGVPIVLVSGAHGHLASARRARFDAVIEKPYRLSELLGCLERVLDENRHA